MRHALKRKGEQIGRDQVARLMRLADVRGVSRRKHVRPSPTSIEVRSPELVRRAWFRDAPDCSWVADFAHVHTREAWMYVSFLQGGFSRRGIAMLVHRRATGWDSREERELATARWVAWFNHDRLHEMLGYFTPIEIEAAYRHRQGLPRQAA